MKIHRLDHCVLTVKDVDKSCSFYVDVLGMEKVIFRGNRIAVKFGNQKINFHCHGQFTKNIASAPTPGSADLCFVSDTPISDIIAWLSRHGVEVELGPIERIGAMGPIVSIYFRDPDQNLVEVCNYF